MKGRSVVLGRNWAVVGLAVLCACMASIVWGNTTNDIPYSESFESISVGTMLAGTNGWYGVSNAVEVVDGDPGFLFGYPIAGVHSNVLELTDAVSNLFVVGETDGAGTTGGVHNPPWVTQETFIDMMVKPVPRDSAPANLDTNVQVAVYLDTDGYLNIYHRYMVSFGMVPDYNVATGVWSKLTSGPIIPTNEWFRLTITMSYLRDPYDVSFPDDANQYDTYFQVRVNGGDGITGEYGNSLPLTYDAPAGVNGNYDGGSWFVLANQGADGELYAPRYWLTSIATEGPGMIDDLVVATDSNALGGAESPYGIGASTYANAGVFNPDGDDDGDGILNWEELVAGTDPGNKDSVFQVTSQRMMGSSNVVEFMASNLYGLNADVTMLRTTNVLATVTKGDWMPIGQVPAGSMKFADTNPPPATAYYKPVIGWTY